MIIAAKGAAASSVGLAYRWVLAGGSGALHTSDSNTLSSWTSRTSSFSTSAINGVASDGQTQYVAVGADGKLATSPDAITWTQRTSSFSTTIIRGIAYGNGVWVAVGDSGKIATSTDGITWTQRTSGTANAILCIGYGNGLWVAGGSSPRTATDPTSTWTSRTTTLSIMYNNFYSPGLGIWVAGMDTGTTGALASSTDGTTWTARDSAWGKQANELAITGNSTVITLGALTDTTFTLWDVQSSTNGTTWTNRTPASNAGNVFSAASDETGLMAMFATNINTSSDGTTWTDRGAAPIQGYACHSSGMPSIR